jgi:hypothetical protein
MGLWSIGSVLTLFSAVIAGSAIAWVLFVLFALNLGVTAVWLSKMARRRRQP